MAPAALLRMATGQCSRLLGQQGEGVLAVGEAVDIIALQPGRTGDADLPMEALLTGRGRG